MTDPADSPRSAGSTRSPTADPDIPPRGRPVIEAVDVTKHFPAAIRGERKAVVHAVDAVSLQVFPGETLGLVGESGCGKSTLGRCLVRLTTLTSGTVRVDGRDVSTLSPARLRPLRQNMQMVFQDPFSSLNPRKRISAAIAQGLPRAAGDRAARAARVSELLEMVGMRPEFARRFPHEFSGGQRQRIGIARALAAEPKVIVADEPVSALDVSIQAQVVNLFADLQESLGLTYVFIAHDLSVVRQISDRIAVMYLGRLVEIGPTEELIRRPAHPYTAALLSAVPVPTVGAGTERERTTLPGDVPSPISPPSGCRFHPRCPLATDRCRTEEPVLIPTALIPTALSGTAQIPTAQIAAGPVRTGSRAVACHYPLTRVGLDSGLPAAQDFR